MKYIFFLFISLNAYSTTQMKGCGSYDLYGELKKNELTKSYDLVVNQGSISEYKFNLTSAQERQVISYLNQSIKVRAKITEMTSDYRGKLDSISKVEHTPPDPANYNESGSVVLVKKEKCK
ncbi:MAG: hypothetical protein H7336_02080 [Bacteriovorax sp.]|nr:hypothetical protein [Bacteriovorax sp.]